MALKISIEISDRDLGHFRKVMQKAKREVRADSATDIVGTARSVLESFGSTRVPEFISSRLQQLGELITMIEDEEWALPSRERTQVLAALAYFSDPEDLIPDELPGLGYLDDAIMVELLLRDLRHQREAYLDFCRFRDSYYRRFKVGRDLQTRAERLAARRAQLYQRMYRRMDMEQSAERRIF